MKNKNGVFEAVGEYDQEIRPIFINRGAYQYVGEWTELSGYLAYFKIVMDMELHLSNGM